MTFFGVLAFFLGFFRASLNVIWVHHCVSMKPWTVALTDGLTGGIHLATIALALTGWDVAICAVLGEAVGSGLTVSYFRRISNKTVHDGHGHH